MPQAPDYLRAMFSDDADAWHHLSNFYDDRGMVRPKIAGTVPTEKQAHAIDYLCLEWDYGYEAPAASSSEQEWEEFQKWQNELRRRPPEEEARLWPDGKRVHARSCGLCLGLGCRMCKGTGRYEVDASGVGALPKCKDCPGRASLMCCENKPPTAAQEDAHPSTGGMPREQVR